MCLNPPRLAAVCALIQAAMPLNSFVLISRGSTDTSNIFSPDFLHFFFFFFNLAARTEQRQQPALEPFDVPLERMCRTTTYSDAFFFPTGGSKEERCGRISCERPFLYVSHTIACLSVEGRPSGPGGWQGKSLCTCSPTQWHRVTTGSDTQINLCPRLRLITYEIKQLRLY